MRADYGGVTFLHLRNCQSLERDRVPAHEMFGKWRWGKVKLEVQVQWHSSSPLHPIEELNTQ